MKITTERLRQIIMEEISLSECGEEMGMDPMMHHDHMDGMDSQSEDVEGLATRAMAAIHDLAVAAGADLSTTVNSPDDEMSDSIEVEFEEDE